MIALQSTALLLLGNPTWKALSLHLIGHQLGKVFETATSSRRPWNANPWAIDLKVATPLPTTAS